MRTDGMRTDTSKLTVQVPGPKSVVFRGTDSTFPTFQQAKHGGEHHPGHPRTVCTAERQAAPHAIVDLLLGQLLHSILMATRAWREPNGSNGVNMRVTRQC